MRVAWSAVGEKDLSFMVAMRIEKTSRLWVYPANLNTLTNSPVGAEFPSPLLRGEGKGEGDSGQVVSVG